jgi:hypothetical protein
VVEQFFEESADAMLAYAAKNQIPAAEYYHADGAVSEL